MFDASNSGNIASTVKLLLLTSCGCLALEEHVAANCRLVLAGGARFPGRKAYLSEMAAQRTEAGVLARLRERGLTEAQELGEAAETPRGMMVVEPQRAIVLGVAEPPADADIRARRCANLLLHGCARESGDAPAHGGEIAWPKPTQPGDVLQVSSEVVEMVPSKSRRNRGMIILRSETSSQNGTSSRF